ncbi:MAG: hypothetical protein ACLFT0_17465 [Spirulinaceae cyanobacterium]
MHSLHIAQFTPITAPTLKAGSWVRLYDPIAPYSDDDEALLLCPASPTTWVTWIPGHGEATLSIEQFKL